MPKSKRRKGAKRFNPLRFAKRARQKMINKNVTDKFLEEVRAHEGYDDMNDEQKKLLGDIVAVKQMVTSFGTIVGKFKSSLTVAKEKYNCRQFQYILQDMESILSHIESLEKDGPMPADKEIPLEESELGDYEGGNSPVVVEGGFPASLPKEMVEDAMAVEAMEAQEEMSLDE